MALEECKECGHEVSRSAKECPNCGVKNPSGSFAGLGCGTQGCLVVVLLVAALYVLGSMSGDGTTGGTTGGYVSDEPSVTNERTTTSSEPDLELLSSDSETDELGTRYVTGRVRNNTSRTCNYVQVSVNLYNSEGTQVGSTLDNVTNLEPGGVWEFKAVIANEDATGFKVAEVSGC